MPIVGPYGGRGGGTVVGSGSVRGGLVAVSRTALPTTAQASGTVYGPSGPTGWAFDDGTEKPPSWNVSGRAGIEIPRFNALNGAPLDSAWPDNAIGLWVVGAIGATEPRTEADVVFVARDTVITQADGLYLDFARRETGQQTHDAGIGIEVAEHDIVGANQFAELIQFYGRNQTLPANSYVMVYFAIGGGSRGPAGPRGPAGQDASDIAGTFITWDSA